MAKKTKENKKDLKDFIKVIVDEDDDSNDFDKIINDFNEKESEHSNEDFQEEGFQENTEENVTNEKIKKSTKENINEEKNDEETDSRSPEQRQMDFEMRKRMFVNIFKWVCAGVHWAVFNFISPVKITVDELLLNPEEISRLDIYVTEELVKVIDFIPTWAFGIAHLETIMISKYRSLVETKQAESKNKNKEKYEEFLKWKENTEKNDDSNSNT